MKHIIYILTFFFIQNVYVQSQSVNVDECCDPESVVGNQTKCDYANKSGDDFDVVITETITITGTGMAGPYTFIFSNGANFENVTTATIQTADLSPGADTIFAFDSWGCGCPTPIVVPEIGCCEEGASCSMTTQDNCAGNWMTGGSCNSSTGLCVPDGGGGGDDDMSGCCQFATDCDDTITQAQCINFGGSWIPGAVCNTATGLCGLAPIPTLSQWGIILLLLLLLTLGSISIIRQGQAALATTSGASLTQQTPLFDAALFKRIVLRSIPFMLLAIALISTIEGGIFARNIVGTLLSGLVLAYLVQFVLRSESSR